MLKFIRTRAHPHKLYLTRAIGSVSSDVASIQRVNGKRLERNIEFLNCRGQTL